MDPEKADFINPGDVGTRNVPKWRKHEITTEKMNMLASLWEEKKEKVEEYKNYLLGHENEGDTILHFACEMGNDNLVKAILKSGLSKDQIGRRNSQGQNAFFYACKFGHVDIVNTLLDYVEGIPCGDEENQEDRRSNDDQSEKGKSLDLPVSFSDKFPLINSSPYHSSLESSCIQCNNLAILFNWDSGKKNCLYIASENKQRDVVARLLTLNPHIWKPLLSMECKSKDGTCEFVDTAFRSIIRNFPEYVNTILDHYFDQSLETNKSAGFDFDYELFTSPKDPNHRQTFCYCRSREKELYKKHHPLSLILSTKAKKLENKPKLVSPLSLTKTSDSQCGCVGKASLQTNGQNINGLINHPVVSSLLLQKWKKVRGIQFSLLAFYVVYLIMVTSYLLTAKRYKIVNEGVADEDTFAATNVEPYSHQKILAITISILSCVGILIEMIQIFFMGKLYYETMDHVTQNLLDWFMYVGCLASVVVDIESARTLIQWEIAVGCMMISWFNVLLHHPMLSPYLYMVVEVVKRYWRFTFVFFFFLLMFGITFTVVLNNHVPYGGLFTSFVKTWTMMLGNTSYMDIFHSDTPVRYLRIAYILYFIILFLGLITTNIWTGFIIDGLKKLHESAERNKLLNQLDFILTIEICKLPKFLKKRLVFNKKKHTQTISDDSIRTKAKFIILSLIGDMNFYWATDKLKGQMKTDHTISGRQLECRLNAMDQLVQRVINKLND